MMDELDLLKKDWNKVAHTFQQYTEVDLYKMIHKKSSSIVKWILIVSILELLLWVFASLYMKNSGLLDEFKSYDYYHFLTVSEMISYSIIVFFIYQFYTNYKKINTSNSVNELINSILKTRKSVQNYVKVVIGFSFISSIIVLLIQFNFDKNVMELTEQASQSGKEYLIYIFTIIIVIFFLAAMLGVLWIFYRIIYGFFLKNLYKNYEELKKLDL
jgi:hypothetical protein